MSSEVVTQHVVGREIRICLGKPVGFPETPGSLMFKSSRWIATNPPAVELQHEEETPQQPSPASSASRARKRWGWKMPSLKNVLVWGAGAALVLTAVVSTLMFAQPAPKKLGQVQGPVIAETPRPAQPAASSVTAQSVAPDRVKVIAEAYNPSAPALPLAPASGPRVEAPVPPQVVAAAKPSAAPVAPVALPAAAGRTAPVSQSTPPAAKKPDEPRVPAVVVDEAPASKPQPQATTVTTTQAVQTSTAPARPVASAGAPAAGRIARLLAITPDGKAAVFSNPTSRLPEQFKLGDHLPTGEVIRTISQKDGRVVTSAKEYTLE